MSGEYDNVVGDTNELVLERVEHRRPRATLKVGAAVAATSEKRVAREQKLLRLDRKSVV